jgi:hypothetical protein
MLFIIKNPDKYQTEDSFIAELWDKTNPTSCIISRTNFSPKGYLLFLNKDI